MTTTPVTDPFAVDSLTQLPPRPARLEIVERHYGDRYGDDMSIVPNGVRINGVPLWCSTTNPVVVEEFTIDGEFDSRRGVVVPLRLLARALRIGEVPSRVDPDAADARNRFATVELPVCFGRDPDVPDGLVRVVPDGLVRVVPYAIVSGHKLLLGGPVIVHETDAGPAGNVVSVTLPLVCRSVVFDDIVAVDGPAAASRV